MKPHKGSDAFVVSFRSACSPILESKRFFTATAPIQIFNVRQTLRIVRGKMKYFVCVHPRSFFRDTLLILSFRTRSKNHRSMSRMQFPHAAGTRGLWCWQLNRDLNVLWQRHLQFKFGSLSAVSTPKSYSPFKKHVILIKVDCFCNIFNLHVVNSNLY